MKMLKKMTMIVMAFTLIFAFTSPDLADAKRSGGFKSGTRSYTTTPKKSTTTDSNVQKSTTTSNNKSSATSTGSNTKRGFFSGGGFMKGLMIGGLAGMLFGGLFSGMGAFGNLLGLAVNLLAIYIVIVAVMALYRRFKNKPGQPRNDNYGRGGRY
ncbi:hypothetical protein SAMN04488542_102133 [Fontibacillus panacisegetis]|uniref:Preprotein translocase subunit Tim44 n=1 Tax=Fontibacillus panacisegetis TaxID=670482 RepID=A0A1G7FSU0_9BACL|nr:hypothetical protein SAMN04488542_102133 [Fontibacillus panacisegetis]